MWPAPPNWGQQQRSAAGSAPGATSGGKGAGAPRAEHLYGGSPGGPSSRGLGGADTTKLVLDKKLASLDQHMYDEKDIFTWAKHVRN